MSPLVKKEIRLIAPSWSLATLLAGAQVLLPRDNFYTAALVFIGTAMMALATFGREASLHTFSGLLAQPAERLRIWQTKLSVLATAFFLMFLVWLVSYNFASRHFYQDVVIFDALSTYDLSVTVCLIAISTFTGGLWAALLLRQIASAFWLSLLVPATLSGVAVAFLAVHQSDEFTISALCIVLGIYSIGGFFFARWLFFRAQDIGWTGGNLVLPESKLFSALFVSTQAVRKRRPFFALLKKEFQLQKASLTGGVALLVLHTGVIFLRTHHHFAKDSTGEIVTSIFWMLWLILPVMIGSMAIAEERRLGVMETQACLPVSPRLRFAVKASVAVLLGTLLGGFVPMVLENIGVAISGNYPVFLTSGNDAFFSFQQLIIGLAAWLTFISLFGSSLAKNFLQAIGFSIVSFIVCALFVSSLMERRMFFFDPILAQSTLAFLIAVPVLVITLIWLAYRNYNHFRDGWPLWRRNILGFAGAIIFIVTGSSAIYNRVWEVFQPIEPAHGAPKLSLVNLPAIHNFWDNRLSVQLPDGRIWADALTDPEYDDRHSLESRINPLPKEIGAAQFISGSNWLSVLTSSDTSSGNTKSFIGVGIERDGSLWLFTTSVINGQYNGKVRLGNDTDWRQIAEAPAGILLLKTDGSLWRFTNSWDPYFWRNLALQKPIPVAPDARWKEIYRHSPGYARKNDNTVWMATINDDKKDHHLDLHQEDNLTNVVFDTMSGDGNEAVYVGKDGKLFFIGFWSGYKESYQFHTIQLSDATNWLAVTEHYRAIVGLQSDGTLWRWELEANGSITKSASLPPQRLGIHNDWVAVSSTSSGAISLAADGTLWLWPDRTYYYRDPLMRMPKRPIKLASIFDTK